MALQDGDFDCVIIHTLPAMTSESRSKTSEPLGPPHAISVANILQPVDQEAEQRRVLSLEDQAMEEADRNVGPPPELLFTPPTPRDSGSPDLIAQHAGAKLRHKKYGQHLIVPPAGTPGCSNSGAP